MYKNYFIQLGLSAVAMFIAMHAMIAHHSGAILMCEQAELSDPQVQPPCRAIIDSQSEEITEMQVLLAR